MRISGVNDSGVKWIDCHEPEAKTGSKLTKVKGGSRITCLKSLKSLLSHYIFENSFLSSISNDSVRITRYAKLVCVKQDSSFTFSKASRELFLMGKAS